LTKGGEKRQLLKKVGFFSLSFIKIGNMGMNKAKKEKGSEEVLIKRGEQKGKGTL